MCSSKDREKETRNKAVRVKDNAHTSVLKAKHARHVSHDTTHTTQHITQKHTEIKQEHQGEADKPEKQTRHKSHC